MSALAAALFAALLAQGPSVQTGARVDAAPVAAPLPELVVQWVYPRAATSHLVEQNIVPREQDVVRMRTSDPAEQVEAFYRSLANDDGGSYSVVSAVNQRIVANKYTVVTIETVGASTVITVVANQPELEPETDPTRPFPVKKGFRPPPS